MFRFRTPHSIVSILFVIRRLRSNYRFPYLTDSVGPSISSIHFPMSRSSSPSPVLSPVASALSYDSSSSSPVTSRRSSFHSQTFTADDSINHDEMGVQPISSPMSGPLSTLQHHFDLQLAQLSLLEQSLKTHFNSNTSMVGGTSVGQLNPVALLARLRLIAEQMPKLQQRATKLAEEREQVEAQVRTLVDGNKELLAKITARVEAASKMQVAPPSLIIPPSTSSPQMRASRPSTAPSNSTPPRAGAATSTRRKSMRTVTVAPPSPSTQLVEAAVLEQIQASHELSGPISEAEFGSVSTTVKSRVKLSDVNHMLSIIQNHFARYCTVHKVKDASSLPPLSLNTLVEEGAPIKIGGASSQCIIGTLRACKRILVGKNGLITLVKPPIIGAK